MTYMNRGRVDTNKFDIVAVVRSAVAMVESMDERTHELARQSGLWTHVNEMQYQRSRRSSEHLVRMNDTAARSTGV